MKRRVIFIFVSIVLLIAYIDLVDSCRQIDLAIEDSLQSKVNMTETISYSQVLNKFVD